MKFTVAAIAAFAGVATASFQNVTTVTIPCEVTTSEVVTSYTTYCPESTVIVENNKTYTVTEATTLTITDCPCTRPKVITTTTVTTCPVSSGKPVLPSSVTPIGPATTSVSPPANSSIPHSNTTGITTVSTGAAAAFGASGILAAGIAAAAYIL